MAENVPENQTPEMPKEQPKPSFIDVILSPLGMSALFILLLVLSVGAFLLARNPDFLQKLTSTVSKNSLPLPTPTPRVIKPLPGGVQVYNFSHGSEVKGPKLQQVTVDPLTPAVGETQTVTATIKHDSPVTEASLILYTDTQTKTYPLTLTSGTTVDGTWQGSWQIPETYDYNYYLKFSLQSATGNYDGGLRLRQ